LDDTPEEIAQKIRRATMDELGMENMKFLYGEFVGGEVPERNIDLKEKLTEGIVKLVCNTL